MTWLVTGATGLLGQALMQALRRRDIDAAGAARSHADIDLDITSGPAIAQAVAAVSPTVIINAAAMVDLRACEDNPALADTVNADAVATLGRAAAETGARLVQISTDHFFTGDGALRHAENAPVTLVNAYARSKHRGENAALAVDGALVVRTNITGRRGWPGRPTLAEWAVDAIQGRKPMTLFGDYFTSTLDAGACADAVIDLVNRGARGVVNVAGRDVASKAEFVHRLAACIGRPLDWAQTGSVRDVLPRRAESCGLDTSRAETILERPMPNLEAVCRTLAGALAPAAHV